jgi:hypothetical protein
MNIIEIKDPNLDKNEILNQINAGIAGKTAPDFSAIGPEILRPTQAVTSSDSGIASGNHEAFIDLMLMHQLEEPEFTSEAPIIGSWIVRLRQLWNWMSTKWYVLPILKQQSMVNGQIALLLVEMEAVINENKQTIGRLQERVNQLEGLSGIRKE